MKRVILITVLCFLPILFNGCGSDKECEPKKIYVKSTHPRMKILYEVKIFRITDIKDLDDRYVAVNKEQLQKASETSNKVRRQNLFYIKQNIASNKLLEEYRKDIE